MLAAVAAAATAVVAIAAVIAVVVAVVPAAATVVAVVAVLVAVFVAVVFPCYMHRHSLICIRTSLCGFSNLAPCIKRFLYKIPSSQYE